MWGDVFVSKHYYAQYLARENEVYYLNPVCLPWQPKSIMTMPIQIEEGPFENLRLVSYGNPVPRLARWPLWFQRMFFWWVIRCLKRRLGTDFDIVWTFDLTRFSNLKYWRPAKSLLHLVELFEHPNFVQHHPHRKRILKSADFVVSIADLITEQVNKLRPDVLQINHGADIEGFESAPSLAELGVGLPGTNKLKAGFVGNFQFSFDFGLLVSLANANLDVDFILIGPCAGDSNLGNLHSDAAEGIKIAIDLPNVHFVGKVPSRHVYSYLKELDINLVLYQDNFWQGHCNPHKMMGYLYAGKPIVSSFIHQYRNRPDLVHMADRNEQIPQLFQAARIQRVKTCQKRKAYAEKNSYESQICRLLEKIGL